MSKEDIHQLQQLLAETEGLPLHIKFSKLEERIVDHTVRTPRRLKRVVSEKMQTEKYALRPFYKNISQF
jgi:hypothetical protein